MDVEDIGGGGDEGIEQPGREVDVGSVATKKHFTRQMMQAIHQAGTDMPQAPSASDMVTLNVPNRGTIATAFVRHALVQELQTRLAHQQGEAASAQMADTITLEKAADGYTLRLPAIYAYRLGKEVDYRALSGESVDSPGF